MSFEFLCPREYSLQKIQEISALKGLFWAHLMLHICVSKRVFLAPDWRPCSQALWVRASFSFIQLTRGPTESHQYCLLIQLGQLKFLQARSEGRVSELACLILLLLDRLTWSRKFSVVTTNTLNLLHVKKTNDAHWKTYNFGFHSCVSSENYSDYS